MKKLTALLLLALPFASLAFVTGALPFANSAVTNTAVLASGKPGVMVYYNISNPNASTVYVQFYDAASTSGITVGTTAPAMWIAVPAGNGVTDGLSTQGIAFQNGIVIAATTTPTGGTAPGTAIPVVLATY